MKDHFAGDFFTVSDPTVIANTLNTGTGRGWRKFHDAPVSPSTDEFYTNLTTSDYRADPYGRWLHDDRA